LLAPIDQDRRSNLRYLQLKLFDAGVHIYLVLLIRWGFQLGEGLIPAEFKHVGEAIATQIDVGASVRERAMRGKPSAGTAAIDDADQALLKNFLSLTVLLAQGEG